MSTSSLIRKTIVCAIFLAMAAQSSLVLAFDVPSTLTGAQNGIQQGEQATGVDLRTILAATGLNSEKYGACTSTQMLGQIANVVKNFKKILQAKIQNFILDYINQQKSKLIYCGISNLFTYGFHLPIPPCQISMASDAKEALEALKDREFQQNFIARCVARIGVKDSVDTITQIMQQQGPYGDGPAWVTSWVDLPKIEEQRAQARFWAILVNTDICPYMKDDVYSHFRVPKSYIDSPPSLSGILGPDSDDPFTLRARCTVPEGITPDNAAAKSQGAGYLALVSLLNQPQNNPSGFIDMAEGALAAEKANVVGAAVADALSGGGVRSIADCVQYSPDGQTCLAAGPNKQTGGTLRDQNAAAIQAEYDWLTNTDASKQAIDDIRTSIANRLFNLSNAPLSLNIELGPETNVENGFEEPTPSPGTTPVPGSPEDLECTGGEPRCVCVKNDPSVQSSIVPMVKDAIARAMQVNPELFVEGTTQIAPGVDPVLVLQAICDRLQPQQGELCRPEPGSSDEIVILSNPTISVDVITGDGNVRSNGGQAVAACEPGVQD